jgi:hypothetical protein
MKPYRVTLRTRDDRALAQRALDRAPMGYRVTFTPPIRSLDQNARLWAMLDEIAEQKEWAGKKRTSEAWKDLFTAALRAQEIVPNLDGDGFIAFGARTSEMSPEEMSDLLQLIETWGAQNGVNFNDQDSPRPGGEREGADMAEGPVPSRTNSERVQ